MQRVNVVVGRFQPFTAGHYICVETAKKLKSLPTVICMINTPESKVDKRHPFTTDLLLYLYNELFNSDPYIEKVVPVKNADIVAIGEELRRYGYEIAAWTCGTDRYATYSAMASKYHDKAGLTDDFEVIEVKRTDEDISATKARSCLLSGDKDTFFSMMPRSMPRSDEMFDALKEQIEKVYGKNERRYIHRSFMRPTLEERIARLERLVSEGSSMSPWDTGVLAMGDDAEFLHTVWHYDIDQLQSLEAKTIKDLDMCKSSLRGRRTVLHPFWRHDKLDLEWRLKCIRGIIKDKKAEPDYIPEQYQ